MVRKHVPVLLTPLRAYWAALPASSWPLLAGSAAAAAACCCCCRCCCMLLHANAAPPLRRERCDAAMRRGAGARRADAEQHPG